MTHLYIQTGCNQRVSKDQETADLVTKGRFIIYEDDRVGKKIIAFLFLSKARPKGILFFRSPFSIWGQIFQSPFKLK